MSIPNDAIAHGHMIEHNIQAYNPYAHEEIDSVDPIVTKCKEKMQTKQIKMKQRVQNSAPNLQSKLNKSYVSPIVISIEISLSGMRPRHPKCPEVIIKIIAF